MRIFYYLSSYISHLTAGLDYVACLRSLGHEVRTNLPAGFREDDLSKAGSLARYLHLSTEQESFAALADTVILHDEPTNFADIYGRHPWLRDKRVIAYTVWENALLSPYFVQPLQLVSEVWTCSEFCRQAIAPHVKKCSVLPHVVKKTRPGQVDLNWVKKFMKENAPEGACFFLSVLDAINPRKNMRGLMAAFGTLQRQLAGSGKRPVRLLLKQYRANLDLGSLKGVLSLSGDFSAGRMAALYALCDAYVSAHHSEGWGLGLSAAMSFGKPVIATGYSGNMQFMDQENSLPVAYELTPVSPEMLERIPLFTAEMQWARPDPAALALAMRQVAEGRFDPALSCRAAAITRRFGPEQVAARLRELLFSVSIQGKC
jgi:glycosyltransferase involved in cell wall biosynthesis